MKKQQTIKEAQVHIEVLLQSIAAGQLVEVTLANTDNEAQEQGWPSAAVMKISLEQLNEALPDSLRKYLKVI